MKSLKGTETEKNLLAAFAGESQARNRYTYFSSIARNEGFMQISAIFSETAEQEKEHAKRLFKFLEGGDVEITTTFPAGILAGTEANLVASAAGENHEWTDMYPSFANVAAQEGFAEIAAIMRNIAVAEKFHETRFLAFVKNIRGGSVFSQPEDVVWHCRNCGYQHGGKKAPEFCPACAHPQAYFELRDIVWQA